MWKHNAFGEIVEGEADFVGYVAYSLYKEQKVKWIQNYKAKTNDYPDSDEIDDFFTSYHSSPDCIKKYREDAERMLNEFLGYTFQEELSAYKETVRNEAIVKEVHKPFKTAVWENLAAGVIASVLTALFSVSIWLYSEMKSSERREQLLKSAPVAEEVKQLIND